MYGSQGATPLSADGVRKAQSLRFWLKIFGILSMVFGGIYCLSIVGILIGWLPILMGLWMYRASEGLDIFSKTGENAQLEIFIGNLRNIYLAMGIGLCIQLVFIVLYIVAALVFGIGAGLFSALGSQF